MNFEYIVLAAFRTDSEGSVWYSKYKTIKGFLTSMEEVLKTREPDYISIRVIRKTLGE